MQAKAMAKPGKLIERAWLDYRSAVIPADARAYQVIESRRAFYAGASALLFTLLGGFTADREPTQADLEMMDAIRNELAAFNEAVKVGAA